MIFLGGGQEELGWRGYILDPLEERLGPWLGNLVLAVIWAVWHVPLIFIPGTSQRFAPFLGFTIVLIGYSYFYAWVRESAGKRTMVGLLAHGWGNAFVPLFPTIVMAEGASQQRYWIWAGLTLLTGVVAMIVRSRGPANQTRQTQQPPASHSSFENLYPDSLISRRCIRSRGLFGCERV
jgi:hypothetical protein